MKIEFINHASLIFSYDNINLITDPWIEGNVFQNGWSHVSKSKFNYSDFSRITHIWFSHEHPDHFFPPNIKLIPINYRKKITVLYQKTKDKKVLEFCKKMNFKTVIELSPNCEYRLTNKFKIINGPFGHDSWLNIKTDKHSLLNTNDCVINTNVKAKQIHEITGDIDLLLTQFSYASKHGNKNSPFIREKASQDKYDQMKLQIDVFKPKYVIPIASYVWFSHEENYYMNDNVNNIDKVEIFLSNSHVKPVILYPGDFYQIEKEHNNTNSITRYLQDLNKIKFENCTKTVPVSLETLKKEFQNFIKKLKKTDFSALLLLYFLPLKIYLSDLDKTVKLSVISGISECKCSNTDVDIEMTSEVLDYCLKFQWGFETTSINGRFQTVGKNGMKKFNVYKFVTSSINHDSKTFSRLLNRKILPKLRLVYNKTQT
jgi:UDP-MurNAc hydroxylase